jgi:hypothetical protein
VPSPVRARGEGTPPTFISTQNLNYLTRIASFSLNTHWLQWRRDDFGEEQIEAPQNFLGCVCARFGSKSREVLPARKVI